ncbi:hypothetical protein ONS95_012318 [Cadophora gregata]|uniref:uncharacterized protein n=1 Tax=Cadophora gregata TaxID=51156 RepID=UPI0026DAF6CF|nr:uncharacterized protein ONS95_012318 [Cadophora gregata]KAK0118007.1 hypothetical protein ONS95_012318 [Cadophora gregata]
MTRLFDGIDDVSARLIVQLQLEDSEKITSSILSAQPGKRIETEHQPGLMAVLLFEEDMQRNASVLQDRRLAIALAGNVAPRTNIRRTATPVEVGRRTNAPAGEQAQRSTTSRTAATAPVIHPTSGKANEQTNAAALVPPPTTVAVVPVPPPAPRFPCVVCEDKFVSKDLVALPCKDKYCFDCLVELFTHSFRDEELYPPRCCKKPIALALLGVRLTPEIESTFRAKGVEYGTANRVYCSGRGCQTFLSPDMMVGTNEARCSTCQATTCTLCKNASHKGDCPEDEAGKKLLLLAQRAGWIRCPGCRRMVELTHGCFHMSCICKMQFCYRCGAHPWKKCRCPQWDQDRLYIRANEAVLARNRANGVAGPAALRDVIEMADQLHANLNCEHFWFESLSGRNQCHMCNHVLPEFIYRCTRCEILLCRQCRRNRL